MVLEVVGNEVKKPRIDRKKAVKPIYSKGEAYEVEIKSYEVLVHLKMIKCLRGRVKGFIEVYKDDMLVLKMKYVNGLLRRSCGDQSYVRCVELVLSSLRIPYRRINISTGASTCQ